MSAWLRRWWPLVVGLAAIALTGLLVPRPGGEEPYDPRSTAPAGTQGVLDVMRSLGHDVSLELDERADVLVVLQDRLDEPTRDRLEELTAAGARLLVTDPSSPLADAQVVGQALSDPFGPTSREPGCRWESTRDVGEITSAAWLGLATDDEPAQACFPVGDAHALLVRDRGEGELIVLASPEPLTNLRLAAGDNAVLAARLLATSPSSSIAIVPPSAPGAGSATLGQLIDGRVWIALWLAGAAFVTIAWAHARRLGRPVLESMPVRVPGSELVHGVGTLLQRSGARDAAARALRRRAVQDLAAATGATVDVPIEVLIERVHGITGEEAATLRTLLVAPVSTDAGLTAVQAGLARLRAQVARGAPPTPRVRPSSSADTVTGAPT